MRVIPVPFVNASSEVNIADTAGSELAPKAIYDLYQKGASRGVHFLNEAFKPVDLVFDPGQFDFFYDFRTGIYRSDMRLSSAKYRDMVAGIARGAIKNAGGERVAFLGGDHSVTATLFREFRRAHRDNAIFIVLDAHPDLCDKGGEHPLHSDWLHTIIVKDKLHPRRVAAIGWRDGEQVEADFPAWNMMSLFPMTAMRKKNAAKKVLSAIESLVVFWERHSDAQTVPSVYLSIDLDVVSPAFAPAVTTPSSCGFTDCEMIELVKGLSKISQLKAFDIVEVDPGKDVSNMTLDLVLRILREMA